VTLGARDDCWRAAFARCRCLNLAHCTVSSVQSSVPALMFVPQPAAELVFDIFVNQPEVPSSI
jgi:hypothetical protein